MERTGTPMSTRNTTETEIHQLRKRIDELTRELRAGEERLTTVERRVEAAGAGQEGDGGPPPVADREQEHLQLLRSRQIAMGEMIGSMAHQWRQPLTAISLLIQDLGECYTYGDFSREYLDTTVRNAVSMVQSLSHMIDDLRGFFRLDTEQRLFSIGEVVDRALSFIESSLRYGSITVEKSVEEDLTANGFPNEFCQVLLTLLGNAKRVFRERGTADPVIRIRAFREGDRAVITIADNSGGIGDGVAARMSHPDFASDDRENIAALGLYMAKTVVERNMGGRLTVDTREGGACFRIEI